MYPYTFCLILSCVQGSPKHQSLDSIKKCSIHTLQLAFYFAVLPPKFSVNWNSFVMQIMTGLPRLASINLASKPECYTALNTEVYKEE